jgi:hypothetical protein
MNEIRRWFGWLIVVLLAHLAEQFLFGIDELYELKGQVNAVLGLFPNPDYGIVAIVGLVVLLAQLMVYGFLVGGRGRLFGPGFFGVSGLVESHHIIKTVGRGAYFPGAVTAIAFVTVGFLLLRAVVREYKRESATRSLPSVRRF